MPGPNGENCGDCYYSDKPGGMTVTQTLVCRWNPPTLVVAPMGHGQVNLSGHLPPVDKDEWCGQYRAKKLDA